MECFSKQSKVEKTFIVACPRQNFEKAFNVYYGLLNDESVFSRRKTSMASMQEVLKKLKAKAKPDQLEGMARFGMAVEKRLGVAVPEMRKIAKETGKDHHLALE